MAATLLGCRCHRPPHHSTSTVLAQEAESAKGPRPGVIRGADRCPGTVTGAVSEIRPVENFLDVLEHACYRQVTDSTKDAPGEIRHLHGAGARLGPFGPVHIRAGAKKDFGGFHQRLGKRGMGMDGECNVGGRRRHLHGEHSLGDEFARAGANDSHP